MVSNEYTLSTTDNSAPSAWLKGELYSKIMHVLLNIEIHLLVKKYENIRNYTDSFSVMVHCIS